MRRVVFLVGTLLTVVKLSSQNIGIGVTNPIARLDVQGTSTSSTANTLTLRNSQGDTLLRMRNDGRMGIGYNGTSYGRTVNIGGNGINFFTANEVAFGGAVFPTDTSLVIWSNNIGNNYVIIQPSWGNTGIGTFTPNAKLHLNGAMLIGANTINPATGYSLSVDGKIVCEDLDIINSGSWPDYVFDEDYPLLSIADLEKIVKAKKHLPNIPSASDIEKNGVSVGQITKAFLEKVEELTLYIIQLKKENNDLERRMKKVEVKRL